MLDAEDLDATQGHLIDTTCYIPSPDADKASRRKSVMLNPKNPFDDKTVGESRQFEPQLF